MEIKNFSDSIRMGHNFPSTIDVKPIKGHEVYGVMATCFTFRTDKETAYVQFRRHNNDKIVGLFAFVHEDTEISEYWKDSTVIWDSRTPHQKSKEAL